MNLLSLDDADMLLEEDRSELEKLIGDFRKTGRTDLLPQIVRKASDLADLYYAALESFNRRFIEYKRLAADYSRRIAEKMGMEQALYLAVLLYLQAGDVDRARILFDRLKGPILAAKPSPRKFGKKNRGPTPMELSILQTFVYGTSEDAVRVLRANKNKLDPSLYREMKRTVDYMVARSENYDKKNK